MVTLHEVITFLVSMQISISSLQTHNVNRCGRSRHLARKLSLRRKRSSPNVFEMAATETITSIILDRKSGSAGMPRPISYAVFCLKKKKNKSKAQRHRRRDGFARQPQDRRGTDYSQHLRKRLAAQHQHQVQ